MNIEVSVYNVSRDRDIQGVLDDAMAQSTIDEAGDVYTSHLEVGTGASIGHIAEYARAGIEQLLGKHIVAEAWCDEDTDDDGLYCLGVSLYAEEDIETGAPELVSICGTINLNHEFQVMDKVLSDAGRR